MSDSGLGGHATGSNGSNRGEPIGDPLVTLSRESNRLSRVQLEQGWWSIAANALVGAGLILVGVNSCQTSQRVDERQRAEWSRSDATHKEEVVRADKLLRQSETRRLLATSASLLADGTFADFTAFYRHPSEQRLRILDWERRSSALDVPPALLQIVGDDGSSKRTEFSAKWWRVVFAVEDIGRAIRYDSIDLPEVMAANKGVFTDRQDPLTEYDKNYAAAIYDRLLSDVRRVIGPSENMDAFRLAYQNYYRSGTSSTPK